MACMIYKLINTVQQYAWGTRSDIPELLGVKNEEGKPQAELWMGAHPKASSIVKTGEKNVPLDEFIKDNPVNVLGKKAVNQFGANLPFLFKVLAAGKSLSIQAHPNLKEAREGFINENSLNIPLNAPNRNYKDNNHKPELICALTPFWAICGFKPIGSIIEAFKQLNISNLNRAVSHLSSSPDSEGLRSFFKDLLTLDKSQQQHIIDEAVIKTFGCENNPDYYWIIKLSKEHPGDIGALSPLLLNVVQLKPGEAMFLRAGVLHAYLQGLGIEVMANSDNVLRGGLTEKHIDIPELLKVLTFDVYVPEVFTGLKQKGERKYLTPAKEFYLSKINIEPGKDYKREHLDSIEIFIIIKGRVYLEGMEKNQEIVAKKGESFLVTASETGYTIKGQGILFRAGIPISYN
jgi:mannose-6-phosphate isomerase